MRPTTLGPAVALGTGRLRRRRSAYGALVWPVLAALLVGAGMPPPQPPPQAPLAASAELPLGPAPSAVTAGSLTTTPEIEAIVTRYAPVLAFDRDFRGLPMDAQTYFEAVLKPVVAADGSSITFARKGTALGSVANNPSDKSKALAALNGVPTYYMVGADPVTGALRIQYWWFYGYQHNCTTGLGSHDADWERVMVTTSPDRTRIDRLTYYQHAGGYTRSAMDGDDPEASVAGWLNLHTSSSQDDRPFPWYPSRTDPDRRPLVYVDRVSHGAFHWFSRESAISPCLWWGDSREPTSATKWNSSANLMRIDPGSPTQTWMLAEAAKVDPSLRWTSGGHDYPVTHWDWGWKDGAPAIDGPVRSFPWDGSLLWSPNLLACSGNPPSGEITPCTRSHGWPAWVTLQATRRLGGVPGAEVGFDLALDRVNLGGGTLGQGQGTLRSAGSVTLTAVLSSGYTWTVSGGRGCSISGGNLLTCLIGTMELGAAPITASVTAPSAGSPYDVGIDAQVSWKAKQQPLYMATARDGPDLGIAASGVGVSYARFYPYKDGYRDTVAIRGVPGEPLSVSVKVSNGTGRTVRSWTLASRTAPWAIAWNGRNAAGTRVPDGTYKVVQTLRDVAAHTKTYTSYTTISSKRLYWSTATVTKYGNQYSMSRGPGTGTVSTGKSAYDRGVWLSSGTSSAVVRYTFSLRDATAYGALTFKVLGRSPNGQKAHEGLWNRWDGSPTEVVSYDARSIGPAYGWYSITGDEAAHREGQKAYGIVYVDYSGVVSKFDVSKVRLVYRYAILR